MKPARKNAAVTEILLPAAMQALRNAHAPYTRKRAGVALRLADDRVYRGCNVESAAFHGVESLETAVGSMLVESRWAAGGAIPEITDVFYCFDSIWDDKGEYRPGPMGLAMLRLFATAETRLHFATESEGVFESGNCADLWSVMPPPGFGREDFARRARERYNKAQAVVAHTGQQEDLYQTRLQAFDPISQYAVGVMIETPDGQVFYGCNVEMGGNQALHAESVAIGGMVTALGPAARVRRLTVLTGGEPAFPCGGCRQHIHEFATPDTVVVATNTRGERQEMKHADLLPQSYGQGSLASGAGN